MVKVLSLFLLVFLLPAGSAQQCFTEESCSGSSQTVSSVEECCLGDGISYDDGAGCMTCIVFGWLDGVRGIEDSEQGQAITLEVGYLKGDDARSLNLRYDVMNIPGTAQFGANNDYTLSNTQNLRPRPNRPVSVLLTLRVDNIALEGRETLSLRLIPLSGASSVRPGVTEFFLDTLEVTIIDRDTVGIKFTVPYYRAREQEEAIRVVVERETRIARPVTVRIVPLNYSEFELLLNSGVIMRPDDFPFSTDDPSPEPVLRAKSVPEERRDFNVTPIEITFNVDQFTSTDIEQLIGITDDDINEADEVFVVILELVDTELSAQVDLEERGASLCRIVDNDPIRIGFERPTYTVAETFVSPSVDLVYIFKEDGRISEQTFELGIQAGAPAQGVASAATRDSDYSIIFTPPPITGFIEVTFNPDDQRVRYDFTPLPDDIPESREAFQLSVVSTQRSAPFQNGQDPITVVFIEDDDAVTVGFEQTSVTVPEDVGTFALCLNVSTEDLPDGLLPAGFNAFIDLDTTAGTAGPEDYTSVMFGFDELQFTDETLGQCFTVTIIDDLLFETLETFNITALPQNPDDPVVIVPPTVTITILDNDLAAPSLGVLIGLSANDITVREDGGSVTVHVMKVGALSSQEPIRVRITTVDNTARAGQDYRATSTIITFGPEDTEMTVAVPLINDEVVEGQESFTGILSLVSPPPNVELAQSEVQFIITDDDEIAVQFAQSSYTVSEDIGTVALVVQKVGINAVPVEVSVSVNSGSATRGIDFLALLETLVVPPGGTQQLTVPISITDDGVPENTEFFEVTIGSSDQVNVGTTQRARVEITDNDVGVIVQVRCFTQRLCQGPATVLSTIRECCLTRDGVTLAGGMSFDQPGREACQTCVVFGWRAGFRFQASEQGEAYSLAVGYLKGSDRAPGNGRPRFDVTDTPQTAVEGTSNDYRLSNTQNLDVRPTRDATVQVTFRVDRVALEPDETLTLTLDPQNTLAMALDSNVFLLETIQLTIQDSDAASFQFTLPTYRIHEEDLSVPVVVVRNLPIATDVTLRITPVNFTVVNVTGFVFPEDFPDLPEFDPIRPIIARSFPEERRDFNITPVEITFPRDEEIFSADVDASIEIFDDVINEPPVEVFVILLEVVSDVPLARVNLQTRNASLCRIVDNDPISIGFEFPRYDFMEQFRRFGVPGSPVFIIKENDRESEQTFEVVVTAGPAQDPGLDDATPIIVGVVPDPNNPPDYRVPSVQTFIFLPDEERIPVPYVLFDDLNPELLEGFLLSSSPDERSPPFQSGANPTTTIAIIDNDVLVIGFTETFTSVSEGIGQFELCLSVTVPPPEVEFPGNLFVFIELLTEDGTALETEDYVRIDDSTNPLDDFSDDLRLQCFDVTIQDDSRFELTEQFIVTAFPFSSIDPVVVNPNVSVVEILDDDVIQIGFTAPDYRVPESVGNAVVSISILNSITVESSITLNVFTMTISGQATDPEDFIGIQSPGRTIVFTEGGPSLFSVDIPIVDDATVEIPIEEQFRVVIELAGPQTSRINIDPSTSTVTIVDDDRSAQQCFTEASCSGSSQTVSSVEECCLGDGISYDDGAGCMTCIVFGWLQGVRGVEDSEQGQTITLEVGYLKGDDARSLNLRYDVMNIPGTAEFGANNDYTISNTQNLRPRPNRPVSVLLTLRVDNIALEGNETLSLVLIPRSPASSPRPGFTEFFLDTLNVTIIDQDIVGIQFTESDYRAREEEEAIRVVVERDTHIARPVILRIVPLNYSEFEELLNSSVVMRPEDFPFSADDPSPVPVLRAKKRRDFSVTPIEVTFDVDEFPSADIEQFIDITDDTINEADEAFVVILELVDTELSAQVDLGERGASLCRIVDNDPIRIGFERPTYTVAERRVVPFVDLIYIFKEDDRISEQTFELGIQAGAPAQGVASAAVLDLDYIVFSPTGFVQQTLFPEEQRARFAFTPLSDVIPESREAFQLSVGPTQQSAPFQSGQFPVTIVFIEDDDAVALCPDPPSLVNGMVTFTGNSVGDTATYTCNSGFELIGSATATCELVSLTAMFSGAPICRPLCPDPRTLVNGMVTFTGNSIGDTATYTCDLGFELIGSTIATCGLVSGNANSAVFSPAPPECRPTCPDPTDPDNGMCTVNGNSIGDTATCICDTGSELVGTVTLTCTSVDGDTAVFSPVPPDVCRPLCPDPPALVNGMVTFTGNSIGDTAFYTCNSGFELIRRVTATCGLVSGNVNAAVFSPAPPECRPTCPDPTDPDNGMCTVNGNSIGDTADCTCDPGFELVGTATLTCTQVDTNTAVFSPVPPVCRPLCPDPPPLENGMVTFTGNSIGDTATYACDSGFELIGSATATCGLVSGNANAAVFSPAPPVCRIAGVAELGFTRGSLRVLESDGSASVTVQLQTVVERTITVRLFTQDDQATAPTDYTAVQRVLTFDSSTTSATIPIEIVSDDFIEADERFFVRLELVPGQSGVIISRRRTRIIIETDDECPELGATVSEKSLLTADPLAIQCVNVCFPRLRRMKICPNRVGTGL